MPDLRSNAFRATARAARRIAVAVIGAAVLAFGICLLVLPGPAIVVIPIGVGILASEFTSARGILPRVTGLFGRLVAGARSLREAQRGRAGASVALAMLIVVASFSASLGFSHLRQRHIQDEIADIVHDATPGIEHLSTIRSELRRMSSELDDRVEEGDAADPGSLREYRAARARVDDEIAAYRALPSSPVEEQLVAAIEERLSTVDDAATIALVQARDGRIEAARAEVRDVLHPRLEGVYRAVEHLSVINSGDVTARAQSVLAARRAGLLIENLLGCVSVLSAIAATLLVVRSLRRRARAMEGDARLLATRASELEAFAGRVAHDLKNPLSAAALNVALARREALPPRVGGHLERVARQMDRLNRIIDGLLEFALAGAHPPTGTHANLRAVASEVVSDLQPAAEAIHAELHADPFPPTDLACTEGALMSVLSNLVGNAVKYVVEGREVPRRITLHAQDRGGATRVEVEDNGPGLPPGASELVFEPFRRLAARQPGIGLGLATVKKIVEAYGGRVGVESTLGRGSSFWFEIPNVVPREAVAR